jgi:hypothetical protein
MTAISKFLVKPLAVLLLGLMACGSLDVAMAQPSTQPGSPRLVQTSQTDPAPAVYRDGPFTREGATAHAQLRVDQGFIFLGYEQSSGGYWYVVFSD